MRLFIALTLACLLAGCVSQNSVSQSDGFYPPKKRTLALFTPPAGWCRDIVPESAPHDAYLSQKDRKKTGEQSSIEISYYRQYFKSIKNQDQLAEDYLSATRSHSDDKIEREYLGDVTNSQFGLVHMYLFHSDYWRFRPTAFLAKNDDYIHVEMSSRSREAALRDMDSFRELLQSIRTK